MTVRKYAETCSEKNRIEAVLEVVLLGAYNSPDFQVSCEYSFRISDFH